RTTQVLFAVATIELDHRRPAIARVELHGAKTLMLDRVRRPHSERVGMAAAPFRIAAIEDRHIAANAVRALEEAAGLLRPERRPRRRRARTETVRFPGRTGARAGPGRLASPRRLLPCRRSRAEGHSPPGKSGAGGNSRPSQRPFRSTFLQSAALEHWCAF